MNIEEAKANIGKEVVLDESTKPYKNPLNGTYNFGLNVYGFIEYIKHDYVKVRLKAGNRINIMPQHLKLKEKPMNYKIRVTPETSKEVQELFFALGHDWATGDKTQKHYKMDRIFSINNCLFYREEGDLDVFNEYQEITLPQLRDMVMLKRNDMNDATHKDSYGRLWIIGDNVQYLWNLDSKSWKETKPMNLTFKELKNIEHISIETIINDKECQKEMTWQDALRSVTDGKEVEFYSDLTSKWHSIETSTIVSIKNSSSKFRLAPQRKTLNGKFTKEELLKIAGEME